VGRRLGERVRALRLALELTQEELADRAKIDSKHVQLVERGRTNPTLSTVVGLADGLAVTLSELFEGI
jgi:transcriptional regulator with XRE-family HTH domain